MGKVKVEKGILYTKNNRSGVVYGGGRKGFDNLQDALNEEAKCCGIDCCEGLIRLDDQVTFDSMTIYFRNGTMYIKNEKTGAVTSIAGAPDNDVCVPDPYAGLTYTPSYNCVTGLVMGGTAGNLTGVTMSIAGTPVVVTGALAAGSKVITLTHTASGCTKTLPAFTVQQCYTCTTGTCAVTPGNKGAGAYASNALCTAGC